MPLARRRTTRRGGNVVVGGNMGREGVSKVALFSAEADCYVVTRSEKLLRIALANRRPGVHIFPRRTNQTQEA
eukprot:3473392-Pyramimonas_sp.AAC.2